MAVKGKLNPDQETARKAGFRSDAAFDYEARPVSYKRQNRRLAMAIRRKAFPLERIVSGGQTGVDRAALDFAIEHGIPHGGWCPRGRLAEDGKIEAAYVLRETPENDYPQRTEWNVRDSDGTVIFTISGELSGGSALTRELASAHGKPCLHLAEEREGDTAMVRLREFIRCHGIKVLNIAGPRLSREAGAAAFARRVLDAM